MIQVSNEFKKAIKQPERRIKGYVEVLYDLPSLEITATTNITSTYTNTSEISNGVRVENLYGSLDYLPLDGSYLTMDTTNTNIGFISDELFENLTTPTITLSFESTSIKGITIYFRQNIPTDLTLNYSDSTTTNIQDNDKETIQVIFDNPKTLTSVSIVINDMQYQDRKIYLTEVDLGITQVYKDQDLIDFTIDEEVNKLVEETPINETNITLNNMSNLFNPLNPTGIVPYLSENTLIKPYIGVLTENLGVEYVKMGEFYFDSYTNNSDATTTLVGKNIMNRLMGELLNDDNEMEFLFQLGVNKNEFLQYMENYNYNIGDIDWVREIAPSIIKSDKLLDLLKDSAFIQNGLLYFDRNKSLNIKSINTEAKDIITKTELINDAEYKKIDKINTINYNYSVPKVVNTVDSRKVLESTVNLKTSPQIFLIKSDSPLSNISISQSGGTSASIIDFSSYLIFVKVTGTVGSDVILTFNSNAELNIENYTETIKSNETENPSILEFNSPLIYLLGTINKFNIIPSYEMKFEYNGDPSLEAGDYINVETPYGYKPLFIQKNSFKFDGGLEGSIEGVE